MLKGAQSWEFKKRPVIRGTATIVGPDEASGPLGNEFDIVHADTMIGQESWEKAEKKMLEEAAKLAIENACLTKEHIQFYVGGDLLNQIISNSFAVRTMQIPYIGIFGACSTSMEGLAVASLIVESGFGHHVMAGTCSHNSTAEKQFRYPTEYGSQKPPTAQYTVTGAACAVVGNHGAGPVVTGATIGRVIDMGIKDPFNMGAAMAPAAVDTLQAHFRDFQREPGYYDLIVTGDLAKVGYEIACELLEKHKVPIHQTTYKDCGLMVFDREKQNVQAGGSGCACSAVVTYGHILKRLKKGELKRVLVVATGALLSPLSFQQGESIPCIAHAVVIESEVR
ncbi:stage V sporulation protein AD [Paenibacillus sp. MZ04-78.2]|uniref:stage V sporulation protein AD n=1 Tax=Paenibacillus sp. MZ04-78.2 TaxID=2962034 RepID=UPI0020B8029C|nr:stage V sporulation protein AD [Paenibacillus sp. MZ04-78.2]MCP3772630.1 stage V sporulation protein AD [Paenibacillus sp. MZ04-78.2]